MKDEWIQEQLDTIIYSEQEMEMNQIRALHGRAWGGLVPERYTDRSSLSVRKRPTTWSAHDTGIRHEGYQ